jgi:hypothetical protein
MKIKGSLTIAVRPGLLSKIVCFCWNRLAAGLALGGAFFTSPYVIAAVPVALLVKLEPIGKPLTKRSRIHEYGG